MRVIVNKKETLNEVLEGAATVVLDRYYYLPGWFEKLPNGEFEFHHMNKLPKELIDVVAEINNNTKKEKN